LKSDGSVKAWGNSDNGGSDPGLTSGVVTIFSTYHAFAALMPSIYTTEPSRYDTTGLVVVLTAMLILGVSILYVLQKLRSRKARSNLPAHAPEQAAVPLEYEMQGIPDTPPSSLQPTRLPFNEPLPTPDLANSGQINPLFGPASLPTGQVGTASMGGVVYDPNGTPLRYSMGPQTQQHPSPLPAGPRQFLPQQPSPMDSPDYEPDAFITKKSLKKTNYIVRNLNIK
jgi:hypothetical protein